MRAAVFDSEQAGLVLGAVTRRAAGLTDPISAAFIILMAVESGLWTALPRLSAIPLQLQLQLDCSGCPDQSSRKPQ